MEHVVLYRKYRPQVFADVVGQEHVLTTLKNSLKAGAIAHAYLFTGPRGTGKTTTARLLAKALNCTNEKSIKEKGEPCNVCEHCKEVSQGKALDLIEIDGASNRGIDEIRNLKESVRFGAAKGHYKVYLVDEVHMLTKEAFNAFLKTLEEPPSYVVFVLATTEPHRLPQTVISRTQRFDFRRLSIEEISQELTRIIKAEKASAAPEAIRLVAQSADGSLRDSQSLLGQILAFKSNDVDLETVENILGAVSYQRLHKFVEHLLSGDQSAALEWVSSISFGGQDIAQLLESLSRYFRHLLLLLLNPNSSSGIEQEVGSDVLDELKKNSRFGTKEVLVNWIKSISQSQGQLQYYPLPQMALEVLIVENVKPSSSNDKDNSQKPNKPEEIKFAVKDKNKTSSKDSQGASHSDIFATLRARWDEIAQVLTSHNHSLSAIVKASTIKNVSKDVLTLGTKYTFNKDRMYEMVNRKAIEDAIEQVAGRRLKIECVLE